MILAIIDQQKAVSLLNSTDKAMLRSLQNNGLTVLVYKMEYTDYTYLIVDLISEDQKISTQKFRVEKETFKVVINQIVGEI